MQATPVFSSFAGIYQFPIVKSSLLLAVGRSAFYRTFHLVALPFSLFPSSISLSLFAVFPVLLNKTRTYSSNVQIKSFYCFAITDPFFVFTTSPDSLKHNNYINSTVFAHMLSRSSLRVIRFTRDSNVKGIRFATPACRIREQSQFLKHPGIPRSPGH